MVHKSKKTRAEKWKLKKDETVYTILRRVSGSGMFRVIDAYVIRDGRPVRLVAVLSDEQRKAVYDTFKRDKKQDGFRVSGVGMDMGFHLVYTISSKLFKDGYALNQSWM